MDIAILIVDDFPLVRRGIVAALQADPGMTVVGEAGSVAEGLELARRCHPDVVLLDLKLADGSGIELIEHLNAEEHRPAVLVMTAIEKLDTIQAAAAAGARGYLTKRARGGELRDAVVTIHGGGTVFDSAVAADLATRYPEVSPAATTAGQPLLTAREREVLDLVGRGHTDKEVAEHLSLSVRTVQNHLMAIRRKTGLKRRTELAGWAVKHSVD